MKAGIVTTSIALCLPATVFITSSRLSNSIDPPVLGGKKVSNSLLRGADSVELENGRHQFTFRVEKTVHLSSHEGHLYISLPLVISFDTQLVSQANFHLPRLSNKRDATHFDDAPRVELLNGDSMPILVRLGILLVMSIVEAVDYEMEIERYNKTAKYASLPQLTTVIAGDSSLLSGVPGLDHVSPRSQTLTERYLKYWFQQADT